MHHTFEEGLSRRKAYFSLDNKNQRIKFKLLLLSVINLIKPEWEDISDTRKTIDGRKVSGITNLSFKVLVEEDLCRQNNYEHPHFAAKFRPIHTVIAKTTE
uniref:Uncharacterized protein n=1 Tax=Caulerpa verticillata TaxID=177082 RepID=A0A386B0D3_9CHLO|nr:hypothetical protein [Caulerpa verticillata]AYC65152.1 hypothetical protein [Caulerpa verticillata]